MEKLFLRFFLFLALLGLLSCGTSSTDGFFGIDDYAYVSGSFSEADTSALVGSGVVRFTSPAGGIYTSESLELAGELDNTGNSVAVVFHSNDMTLPDTSGVIVKFTRTSGAALSGIISVGGAAVAITDSRLLFITPGSFDVIIEVHNTLPAARVLIWRKDSVTYSLANVDVDSNVAADLNGSSLSGWGQGVYAGLKLSGARVTQASMGSAKLSL